MKLGETVSMPRSVQSVTMLETDDPERDGQGAVMFVVHTGRDAKRIKAKVVTGPSQVGISIKQFDSWTDGGEPKVYTDYGRIWDYSDTMQAIHFAMGEALAYLDGESKRRSNPSQAELDEFIGEKLQKTLTLNRDRARSALRGIQSRQRKGGGVEIFYEGKWLHLCRTDLVDDIRTWTSWSSKGDPNDITYYDRSVVYGARITDDSFYIVDAYSDG